MWHEKTGLPKFFFATVVGKGQRFGEIGIAEHRLRTATVLANVRKFCLIVLDRYLPSLPRSQGCRGLHHQRGEEKAGRDVPIF